MEFHFHTGHPEKLSYLLSLRPQFFCAAPGMFSLGHTPITTPRQEEDTISDIFCSNSLAEKRSRRAALLLPAGYRVCPRTVRAPPRPELRPRGQWVGLWARWAVGLGRRPSPARPFPPRAAQSEIPLYREHRAKRECVLNQVGFCGGACKAALTLSSLLGSCSVGTDPNQWEMKMWQVVGRTNLEQTRYHLSSSSWALPCAVSAFQSVPRIGKTDAHRALPLRGDRILGVSRMSTVLTCRKL